MYVTNYELCARYLENTVLPYLRLYCNIDAEQIEYNSGNDFAFIDLDAPKNFLDIVGYIGITVSVSDEVNPNIEPLKKHPTISGVISSFDDDDYLRHFTWQSLQEMVDVINYLK